MTGQKDQSETLPFEGKTILISGGTGFLASALVEQLKDTGCNIIRLHRSGTIPSLVAGLAKVRNAVGDVSDPATWERNLSGVDYVFHFAAQTSTYVANSQPVADQAVNVQSMLHLLEICRLQGRQPTVCFASTVTVAGIPKHLPVDESQPDHPLTVYDLHKSMAEQYLRWYSEQGFVQGVTLRLANIYGPGPRSSKADRGILNQMILKALAGETLTVYGAGDQVRDYLYVEDAARAFLAAAQHSDILNGKYYVIGSGQGHTITEAMRLVADRATAKTGKPVQVLHVDPPRDLSPIEQRHFVADSSRFRRKTCWEPFYTLVEGIDRTLEAFA